VAALDVGSAGAMTRFGVVPAFGRAGAGANAGSRDTGIDGTSGRAG